MPRPAHTAYSRKVLQLGGSLGTSNQGVSCCCKPKIQGVYTHLLCRQRQEAFRKPHLVGYIAVPISDCQKNTEHGPCGMCRLAAGCCVCCAGGCCEMHGAGVFTACMFMCICVAQSIVLVTWRVVWPWCGVPAVAPRHSYLQR